MFTRWLVVVKRDTLSPGYMETGLHYSRKGQSHVSLQEKLAPECHLLKNLTKKHRKMEPAHATINVDVSEISSFLVVFCQCLSWVSRSPHFKMITTFVNYTSHLRGWG